MGIKDKLAAQAAEREAAAGQQKADHAAHYGFYATSVSLPVHMGASDATTLAEAIGNCERKGWKLDAMTTVYAEKLGVNTLIHTLVFRSTPPPPPPV